MTGALAFLSHAFYALTIAALGFFLHKVLWLVEFRRLQRGLVDGAIKHLREGNATVLREWETFARSCWSSALGQEEVQSPSSFIRRVEEWLGRLRADMGTGKSLEALFGAALAGGHAEVKDTILSVRRLSSSPPERYEVTVELTLPGVGSPAPPDKKLFALQLQSRYGLVRRAVVFFSGAANVVYSSQHVARMSQNVRVPTGVLVRRLSLVLLVIAVVLVDAAFGARAALTELVASILGPPAPGASFVDEHLAPAVAFGLWMACYGALYLALYALVRRRYQSSVRRLQEMLTAEATILKAIRAREVRELVKWGKEYGRSLDGSLAITLRHAETLLDHCAHRLRRRIAGPELLDGARVVGDALFAKLPESAGKLEDGPTTHPHSLAHYVWPRVGEMNYQVVLAQYRTAWQHLELAVNDLRKERPDPHAAHSLWRAIVTYATIFADILPGGMVEQLRNQYRAMVESCVEETDRDLEELDRRIGELARSSNEQLECARGLVASRVELANQRVVAQSAAFSAEIIQVREQARLEAMAFEI